MNDPNIPVYILNTLTSVATLTAVLYFGRKLQILEDIQVTMEKIKHNLKVVTDHLIRTNKDFNHQDLRDYSPLRLTGEGRQLIKQIGFDKVLEQHKDDFMDYIKEEEPRLKYDVEKLAITAVHINSSKSYMDFLKIYFYNNPQRDIQNTAPTLGVYIRDIYLKNHPEISQ